ncbi:ATP-binding protein [Geoalkalibacter sp.]|uniref:ATP-binding protein n=1 Tax=Geoalkalibacter sp. TaxID=3041440 RepID=UPI00272E1E43|nr:ATP-binding protein [Geoalkalibacter sp.]
MMQDDSGNIPRTDRQGKLESVGISFLFIALFWTLVLGALAGWNYYQTYQFALENARTAARHGVGKDRTFRRWATGHGGVYVPVTEKTPPNPYLTHVFERDISTPSGRPLTLVNPAYMLRQMHEMADDLFGTRGHITSLKPLRPENAPDAWQIEALQAFARGVDEWSSKSLLDGEVYVRLMRPMIAEEGCLKCHGHQGYQVGDVLGGVSVAVPWEGYRRELQNVLPAYVLGYGGLWGLGLYFIARNRARLRDHLRMRGQVETLLRERTRELEERGAELERFNYTVSHDLKSPLVTVKSFLGFLEDDLKSQDARRIQMDMEYMRVATRKMSQLLDELLEMSRIGRLVNPPVSMSFADLMEEVLLLTAGSITERGVEVLITAGGPDLYGDRPRLVEIWQNLVENAVKYMGAQSQPRIDIGFEEEGGETIFFVRDNGMGIDPRYFDKIFGLFEKLDKQTEGSGLGLALVKRIVQLNGGRIWVESAGEGQGACFRFTLPETLGRKARP